MDWVPPGYTTYFPCVRLKNAMKGISEKIIEHKELDHELIYI